MGRGGGIDYTAPPHGHGGADVPHGEEDGVDEVHGEPPAEAALPGVGARREVQRHLGPDRPMQLALGGEGGG